MKLKLTPLLLSLCLAILPATLRADNKTVTEADAGAPISINKGDTITFSLKGSPWVSTIPWGIFSDSTIPSNDPKATLLSFDADSSYTNASQTLTSDIFNANNSGQVALDFLQAGSDRAFPCVKTVSFIVNIK